MGRALRARRLADLWKRDARDRTDDSQCLFGAGGSYSPGCWRAMPESGNLSRNRHLRSDSADSSERPHTWRTPFPQLTACAVRVNHNHRLPATDSGGPKVPQVGPRSCGLRFESVSQWIEFESPRRGLGLGCAAMWDGFGK